jgi:ATP-dependent Clp protease ATP-binding subunit ClpX
MDGVELDFEKDALDAIAEEAIGRNTGARGLRSIMENLMMPLMYEIPSRTDVQKVIITRECVTGNDAPMLVLK